jgi:hypothetical protein
MDAVILGVVGVLAGGLVALYGVRVFYLLLPLWGFVAGFLIGADAVTELLGDGFLATAAGWAAGLALGVALAVTATLWLWGAVLVLAFGVGTEVGSGLLLGLGFQPGILPFAAGVVLGAALVVLAIAVDGPVLLVAVLTALGGTALVIDGALMVLHVLQPGDLAGGAVAALRGDPMLVLAWLVLAAGALAHQLLDTTGGRRAGLRMRLDRTVG